MRLPLLQLEVDGRGAFRAPRHEGIHRDRAEAPLPVEEVEADEVVLKHRGAQVAPIGREPGTRPAEGAKEEGAALRLPRQDRGRELTPGKAPVASEGEALHLGPLHPLERPEREGRTRPGEEGERERGESCEPREDEEPPPDAPGGAAGGHVRPGSLERLSGGARRTGRGSRACGRGPAPGG